MLAALLLARRAAVGGTARTADLKPLAEDDFDAKTAALAALTARRRPSRPARSCARSQDDALQ